MEQKVTFFTILIISMLSFINNRAQTVDVEKERIKLIETDKEFSKMSIEKGAAEAFYHYMDQNGIMLPHGSQPVIGKENVKAVMSQGSNGTLEWEPEFAEASKCGDLGYTWGRYIFTSKDENGKETQSHGKYISIWKKRTDGSWKWVVDIGNQNPKPEN